MTSLSEMGAIVAPPVPAFYPKPATLEAMVDHSLGRMLDLFDIDVGRVKRWREEGRRDEILEEPAAAPVNLKA